MIKQINLQGQTTFGKTICATNVPYGAEIDVRFADGQNATYTMEIFFDLLSDPAVEWIADNMTGELYLY